MMRTLLLSLLAGLAASVSLAEQSASPTTDPKLPADPAVATPQDYVLFTFILRHDQSRNLAELQQVMKDNRFWAEFPPEGIQVESWYAVIGLGQVVTLRVPPARLREVNLAMERTAWKIFRTEAYAAYDMRKIAGTNREKAKQESASPR